MPTLNVILNGARGGQGTSTIAAALALYAAGHARTQLVATDASATAALVGIPEPTDEETIITDQLTLTGEATGDPEVRIIDAGSARATGDGLHLVVLRGPCYVALCCLVRSGARPDGLILLGERGRSLTDRDVHDVTGIPVVATVAVTAAVARAIDAGLLIARLYRLGDLASLRRYATRLLRLTEQPDDPAGSLAAPLPGTPADLNVSSFQTLEMIGTDWPLAQSASGRRRFACRVRGFERAFLAVRDRIGGTDAQRRGAGPGGVELLRGGCGHLGGGLLHGQG